MTATPPARPTISASAVGEYVYCARSQALRRVADGADDPARALRHAQGLPADWRPAATARLARREWGRAAALAAGVRAHRRHDGRARFAGALSLAGALLIVAALALSLLPLLATPR
jgi:hypothetical protein